MNKFLLIFIALPLLTNCTKTAAPVVFLDSEVPRFVVVEENEKLTVEIETSHLNKL